MVFKVRKLYELAICILIVHLNFMMPVLLLFARSHKARLKLLEDNASQALLDLDIISGLTEIKLQADEGSGLNFIRRFGVSVGPSLSTIVASSQLINIVPRYVIVNESEGCIIVRQCDLEVCSQFINT